MAKRKVSRRQGPTPETPTCNCALLCDDVLVSHGHGKHTLSGIIGMIVVRALPAALGPYVTYVRISNVYGDQKVTVNLEHADTFEAVFEFEATLPQPADPLGVYTLMVRIPPFSVSEAGRYMFNAKSGGVPLAQSPIMIQVAQPAEDDR